MMVSGSCNSPSRIFVSSVSRVSRRRVFQFARAELLLQVKADSIRKQHMKPGDGVGVVGSDAIDELIHIGKKNYAAALAVLHINSSAAMQKPVTGFCSCSPHRPNRHWARR